MKIALVGFAGSGKDTVGKHLVTKYGFTRLSFADPLKDALASIFLWDRELLEGETPESREWRNQVDTWWANKLNIPDFTPRKAMQLIGTDVLRKHLHNGLWIHNLEKRLYDAGDNVVIQDCRFKNELHLANRYNFKNARVKRGDDPDWMPKALYINQHQNGEDIHNDIPVHVSEWSWIGTPIDTTIDNDSDITALLEKVDKMVENG